MYFPAHRHIVLGVALDIVLGALLAASALPSPAQASERVELRNGFSYDCLRHETLPGGQVRLFLASGLSGQSDALSPPNYIDVPASRIRSTEWLPYVPSPAVLAETKTTAVDVAGLLSHAGSLHNIDRELLASIVQAESSGRSKALSHVGARGLMQLMPGTAKEMGVADAFQPEDNIQGGSAYLDLLLTRYRDNLALALAAYNAGPAAVDRFHGIPPFRETRLYVARVMLEFKRRKQSLAHAAKNTAAAAGQAASIVTSLPATVLPVAR